MRHDQATKMEPIERRSVRMTVLKNIEYYDIIDQSDKDKRR